MKKITIILIMATFLAFSGCIGTKIYLGGEKEDISGQGPISRAIDPTSVPAGGTWGTVRAYINENFEEIDLAIDTLDNGLADAVDSIAAHRTAIQLRLLKSDSTIFASQHDLATGLVGKQDTFTLKTINGESLVGSGDITIEGGGGSWGSITGTLADQEDLSDALASKQDTSVKITAFVGLANGPGQLTNDGTGNYSWVPSGGTGTVTSVGLSVPLGFTVTNSPITSSGDISLAFTTGYSLPMTVDQVNWSSAYDWVNTNGANAVTAYGWGDHAGLYRPISYVPAWSEITSTPTTLSGYGITDAQSYSAILAALAGLSNGSGQLTNNGSGTLSWEATGGTGTVTSVGLSAPTGFTVSNSPITTNGTITMSFTAGYSLPLITDQTNWTTAYNNRVMSASGTAPLNLSLSSNALTGSIDAATTSTAGTMSAADKLKLDHQRDSLTAALNERIGVGRQLSDYAVMKPDTLNGGNYYTQRQVDSLAALKENALGNPLVDGYVPSKSVAGVVTWVANGAGSQTWPAAAGIMVYDGSSTFGTSLPAPSGDIVGTSDTQTLTNKTMITSYNAQTGTTYTLVLTDAHKVITMTNASANVLTVPPNSSVAFPIGTQITIVQNGTGQTSITNGSGVGINSAGSALSLRIQYSACTLIKVATDTWLLIGDIE